MPDLQGIRIACSGCGAVVDPSGTLPFRCPNAMDGDDIDHVIARHLTRVPARPDKRSDNPFLRYRHRLLAHHLALELGLGDDGFGAIVEDLDSAVARVEGHGFSVTPFFRATGLEAAVGAPSRTEIWIKDETENVGGSHKARHLMGVMLYLRVLEVTGAPLAAGLRDRRLAIASCGNAALAAAVIARATDWPIDVFVPSDAEPAVIQQLADLGVTLNIVRRESGQTGDPCYLAFRQAVAAGSLPFGVQGNENGLALEGGHTLGWEMAEALIDAEATVDLLFVQVGGGALGTACLRGLREALPGSVDLPRLFTVQTIGAHPLKLAFEVFKSEHRGGKLDLALKRAARERSRYMRCWDKVPRSVAHGILDDETYDWLALVEGMASTGGDALVATEDELCEANRRACEATEINASHTGTAGLAGLIGLLRRTPMRHVRAAVLFTGVERQ